MISFACEKCGKKLKASEEQSGKKARCGQCNEVVVVPAPESDVIPDEIIDVKSIHEISNDNDEDIIMGDSNIFTKWEEFVKSVIYIFCCIMIITGLIYLMLAASSINDKASFVRYFDHVVISIASIGIACILCECSVSIISTKAYLRGVYRKLK